MNRCNQVWENYQKFSDERGWLVAKILSQFTSIKSKSVFDFGCGTGGTSRTLAQMGARITAFDIKPEVKQFINHSNIVFVNRANEILQLKSEKYDIIILQDVIEHVPNPDQLMRQLKHKLKPDGMIYISTPNRFSILNAVSDPHWNLPIVALFPRKVVAFLVQKVFRRDKRQRTDWAALLSLKKMTRILKTNNFNTIFVNTQVVKILFQNPQAVVCHPAHIQIVQWICKNKFDRVVYRIVNDRWGFFNYFINPTWYIIGRTR